MLQAACITSGNEFVSILGTDRSLAKGENRTDDRHQGYDLYNHKNRPLYDAYALAQKSVGSATNTFYCVTASCIEMTNAGFTGWTFSYANTNGQRGRVNVYFDGEVSIVARPGEMLIK